MVVELIISSILSLRLTDYLLLIFSLLSIYLFRLHFNRTVRILCNLFPGPSTLPVLGNVLDITNPETLLATFVKWGQKYNNVYRIFLGYQTPTLVVSSPEMLEKLMSSKDLLNKSVLYDSIRAWLHGDALLSSGGELWHQLRKIITPAFHFRILESFEGTLNRHARKLCRNFQVEAKKNGSFDVGPVITKTTLEIICETAMGTDPKLLDEATVNKLLVAFTGMTDLLWERARKPWFGYDFIWNLTPQGRKEAGFTKLFNDFTDRVIQERKQKLQKGDYDYLETLAENPDVDDKEGITSKSKRSMAFLDMMLLRQSQGVKLLTDETIRRNTATIIFAGHDTTSSAMAWTIYNLGRNAEIQKTLQEELDEVFGDDSNKVLKTFDLANMKYLECCIKETLRMYPSAPIVSRHTPKDFPIGENRSIPAGSTIMFAIHATHQNPEIFPHPEKFDPSRFFPETVKGRHPYAYVPFSAGPRNCVGMRFAMLEMKILLAHLLHEFSFRALDDLETVVPLAEVIIRPKKGIRVEITKRC